MLDPASTTNRELEQSYLDYLKPTATFVASIISKTAIYHYFWAICTPPGILPATGTLSVSFFV